MSQEFEPLLPSVNLSCLEILGEASSHTQTLFRNTPSPRSTSTKPSSSSDSSGVGSAWTAKTLAPSAAESIDSRTCSARKRERRSPQCKRIDQGVEMVSFVSNDSEEKIKQWHPHIALHSTLGLLDHN